MRLSTSPVWKLAVSSIVLVVWLFAPLCQGKGANPESRAELVSLRETPAFPVPQSPKL